jgi:hypothetical protein
MAVIGLVAILIELVLIVPRALRLNLQAAVLVDSIEETRVAIEASLAELRTAGRETHILWRPYRRVVRWLSHPLTIAVFESYRRRRSGNGIGRQGNQASPVDRVAR